MNQLARHLPAVLHLLTFSLALVFMAHPALALDKQQPTLTRNPYLQKHHAGGITLVWCTGNPDGHFYTTGQTQNDEALTDILWCTDKNDDGTTVDEDGDGLSDLATNSLVYFGLSLETLLDTPPILTNVDSPVSYHEVTLSNLSANTKYYYAIGYQTADGNTLLTPIDEAHHFITAPTPNNRGHHRIWAIGDSGLSDRTNGDNVKKTITDLVSQAGQSDIDLWLMLGDNAYKKGYDDEYQVGAFEAYPNLLRNRPLWPTYGNHDSYSYQNPFFDNVRNYYWIFSLPDDGIAGGLSSGHEWYYSFDYGNIHFICLNSSGGSHRQPGSDMIHWINDDLAATDKDWIIAYFHHSPYTKSNHDSDTETDLIEVRENVIEHLENGGVDLVVMGHSHSYERSYFMNGHHGPNSDSQTFNAQEHIVQTGNGRQDGDGAYTKVRGGPGTVYVVAGNASKITDPKTLPGLDHPAMFYSAKTLGSVLIDVNDHQLDVHYLRERTHYADTPTPLFDYAGLPVDDYFTIYKQNAPVITNSLSRQFAKVGKPFQPQGSDYYFTASGSQKSDLIWSVKSGSQLPPGMRLSEAGLYAGTPTQKGFFTFTVEVTNAAGHSEKAFNHYVRR